mmetsp:Transcript_5116/g.5724  ORF Transcript_5116/g.5724 Transcript_5116/m.5724 type:complete len:110 (+) Transcript_5116:339-668(+)
MAGLWLIPVATLHLRSPLQLNHPPPPPDHPPPPPPQDHPPLQDLPVRRPLLAVPLPSGLRPLPHTLKSVKSFTWFYPWLLGYSYAENGILLVLVNFITLITFSFLLVEV